MKNEYILGTSPMSDKAFVKRNFKNNRTSNEKVGVLEAYLCV